jgi:hypothetical protein
VWKGVLTGEAMRKSRPESRKRDAASQQDGQRRGQVSQDEKAIMRMQSKKALRPIMGNSQNNKITGGNHEERRDDPP